MIHTAKGFGIVNKAEIGVFLELSCFVDDPALAGLGAVDSSHFCCSRGLCVLSSGSQGSSRLPLFQLENEEHDLDTCETLQTCPKPNSSLDPKPALAPRFPSQPMALLSTQSRRPET